MDVFMYIDLWVRTCNYVSINLFIHHSNYIYFSFSGSLSIPLAIQSEPRGAKHAPEYENHMHDCSHHEYITYEFYIIHFPFLMSKL